MFNTIGARSIAPREPRFSGWQSNAPRSKNRKFHHYRPFGMDFAL